MHQLNLLSMCHLKTGLEPRVEYPGILFLEWITVLEKVIDCWTPYIFGRICKRWPWPTNVRWAWFDGFAWSPHVERDYYLHHHGFSKSWHERRQEYRTKNYFETVGDCKATPPAKNGRSLGRRPLLTGDIQIVVQFPNPVLCACTELTLFPPSIFGWTNS